MLHKDPFLIAPDTFDLIVRLQAMPILKEFNLVGGTALTLQIGHRNSIDIDLFTNQAFKPSDLLDELAKSFEITPSLQLEGTLLSVVNNIKVDFIHHDYELLYPPIVEEGIRMLSSKDIAAMKLNAIVNSGQRLKDFIDIYYLLEHHSLDDMLRYYTLKYPKFNALIALRALTYFDEIDPAIDPPKMQTPLPLEQIKKRIRAAVLYKRKRF